MNHKSIGFLLEINIQNPNILSISFFPVQICGGISPQLFLFLIKLWGWEIGRVNGLCW